MIKYIVGILLLSCFNFSVQAQIQGNSGAIPESKNENTATSVIKIAVYQQKDSTGYVINCSVVEGKDAIKITTNKYAGLTLDFHRSMSKSMLTQSIDSRETEINIKTIFSGIYYLDIIDAKGVKIKTFTVEKNF